jgi:glycosyltransferase involved in cell wall biosynthesis
LLARLNWVDEIIVVDGESRDATAAIARRHGCHVWTRPFDTYARQRNFALDQARGDWVLSVDADERPTPALAREIRARLQKPLRSPGPRGTRGADLNAFRVPIRSEIFGRRMRYSGTQDDRPVRLFRRGFARWTGDVHEVLQVSGRVGRLGNWLEHETLPDLTSFLAKMNRYTSLAACERVAAGRGPRLRDAWLAPPLEIARRLIWKRGCLDGPEGWAFCVLSGLSQWVLAQKHRQRWAAR